MAISEPYKRPNAQKTDTYAWELVNRSGEPFSEMDSIQATVPAAGALLSGFASADAVWADPDTADAITASGIPLISATGAVAIPVRDGKAGDTVTAVTKCSDLLMQLDSGATLTQNAAAYFIIASGEVTHVASTNVLIGTFKDTTKYTSASGTDYRNLKTGKDFGRIDFNGKLK